MTIKPKIVCKRHRIAFLASLSLSQNLVRYECVHWRESLRNACISCHLWAYMLYFQKLYSICVASSCVVLTRSDLCPFLYPFHPAASPSSSLMVITQQQEGDVGWVICILYQMKSTPSPMSIFSSPSSSYPLHSSKHESGNQLTYPSTHEDLADACKSDGGSDARVSLVFLDAHSVSSGTMKKRDRSVLALLISALSIYDKLTVEIFL
jgi:hypothetical protein